MKNPNIRLLVGYRVRTLRQSAGISQEAFADKVGYSRSYMSQIERGVANITIDAVQVLADAFGIKVAKLFDFDNKTAKPRKRIKVPFAKDGSFFSPANKRSTSGKFSVGEKSNEIAFTEFEDALQYLKTMDVAKWRRPNQKGNWGIVSAVKWGYIEA
ncbi:helix-turn-helix transcriptional regulator [Polynucleobacter sp. 78F-HAINBA]|uniref:helix-turn-helix domain-containing protein n=1 Tax=Polynucleobacter sp. 78F-HAINBA TaxID=2689099 RepID=UPI001C0ACE7F|nr:helix-turn-helix transcriptional regulator [Polynucleobacter sp. 78F-HAINBA]